MTNPPRVFPSPTHWAVSRWGADPYSRGSWSYLRPGGSPDDRAVLAEPISDGVILAGEAVHRTRPAMVHGAYETGRAAAEWCGDASSVIIVGAGAAGIGAAEVLGDRCVVVEARDRIGGRIDTVMLGDAAADLGAAWMQQYGDNAVAERVRALDIASVPTDFARPIVRARIDNDAVVVHENYQALKAACAAFIRAEAGGDGWDGSVPLDPGPWLGSLAPAERAAASRMIEGDIVIEAGAPTTDISSKWMFSEPGVGEGDCWLPSGYGDVLSRLVAGIDVRLGWPVTHIEHGGSIDEGVVVSGPSGTMCADRAIVTVPISILQADAITFEPSLPHRHRRALDRIGLGTVEKVVLRFAERWWPHDDNGYFRWFDKPTNFVEWLDLTDHVGAPVVTGLISAPHTLGWYNESSDFDIAMRATQALHRCAGMFPSSESSRSVRTDVSEQ